MQIKKKKKTIKRGIGHSEDVEASMTNRFVI